MPPELLIALLIAVIVISGAIAAVAAAPRLRWPARILALLLFLPVTLFSVFGFVASFEPGDYHIIWRILYATVFISCVAGAGRIVTARRPSDDARD